MYNLVMKQVLNESSLYYNYNNNNKLDNIIVLINIKLSIIYIKSYLL